jgi:hypothetical protein
MFPPPPDRDPKSRTLLAVSLGVGFVVAIVLGGLLLLRGGGVNPSLGVPAPAVVVIIMSIAAVMIAVVTTQGRSAEKAKRGLEGLDMYSLIDRLVDDLDDDELAYLQRRLDERESGGREDLEVSVKTLLDQRDEDRAVGRH